MRRGAAALALLLLCAAGCARSNRYRVEELEPEQPSTDPGGNSGRGGMVPSFPDNGINAATLLVTSVQPGSGPFAGGNAAVVRGSGFSSGMTVFFGGRMVQPSDTMVQDRNSILVTVPAGEPGPVEVTVLSDTDKASKADAYVYSPLLIEPASGSIAGNTSVLITADAVSFDADVSVEFGGQACTELRVEAPHVVRCKTPPGQVGVVDVKAYWPDQSDLPELTAEDAFEYLNLTDNDYGGLSGGPITGTLNITVVDTAAGFAVPDAFVLIGDDPTGPYQGRTNERGQITFSGDDLQGPVTVHVVAKCMERTSIVTFDAANVTVHVAPLMDPSCGMPGEPPPAGPGMAGSLISGELIFPGADEFAVNAWDVVPPPRDDEVRVAYVFTTRASVGSSNPIPNVSGTTQRVLEDLSPVGTRGYPYRIFARPAGLAVYALSGLERRDTGEFTPYIMGVTRDVVTAPGAENTGVDIHMNIPLDQEFQVALAHLPDATPRGPDQFRVRAHVDLGGEGVIVRQVNGPLDQVTSFTGGSLFRLFGQPALIGNLRDASYQVISGWYSGDRLDQPPYTEARRMGVSPQADPLLIDDFLAFPKPFAPLPGARLPSDRVLRWDMADQPPDLYMIEIVGGDGQPAWYQIVPGTQAESPIPDLSSIDGLEDIAPGGIIWSVRAIRIEDFVYNEFKYNALSPRMWTHTSVDVFSSSR